MLALGLLMTTSCKKDKAIERNLWANGGKWNIDKVISEDHYDGAVTSETTSDAGLIKFERDGSGYLLFKFSEYNGVHTPFTYTNTKEKLYIMIEEDSKVFSYDIEWKINNLNLVLKDYYDSDNPNNYLRTELELKKMK